MNAPGDCLVHPVGRFGPLHLRFRTSHPDIVIGLPKMTTLAILANGRREAIAAVLTHVCFLTP